MIVVSAPVTAAIAATAFAPTGPMPFFTKLSEASLVSLLLWMASQTALTPSSLRSLKDKSRAVSGALTSVDLSGNHLTDYGSNMTGIKELAAALGVNGGLTVANLLRNQLDAESAKMLAEVAKQKGISVCGIQRDQTTAYFRDERLQPPDAILLASDLSQAIVTGALTKIE